MKISLGKMKDELHDLWQYVKEYKWQAAALLVILLLLVASCEVMANGNHDKNSHHPQESALATESVSTADAFSDSSATGGAGGAAEGGAAEATGGSVGDITNSTAITNPDDIKLRNTPGVYTGAARGNAGVGFSVPGFGFSMNGPWGQEDEKKLRLARFLWEMGSWGASRRVMCTTHRLEQAFAEMPAEVECFASLGGESPPPK
jgi:hypothetical protein